MPSSRDSSFYSGGSNYRPYYDSDDDMKFKKLGSLFSSLKLEAKPLISTFASEARNRGSSLVTGTKSRLAESGYINSSAASYVSARSEFTDAKDNSSYERHTPSIDSDGNSIVDIPEGSEITLYPSYTLHANDKYYVEVRGWLTSLGTMSRKNRIVFSLAKQLIKPGAHSKAADMVASSFAMQTTGHADSGNPNRSAADLLDPDDTLSIKSGASDLSSLQSSLSFFYNPNKGNNNVCQTAEDILKERIAYFFARSLASVPLIVVVCSEEQTDPDALVKKKVVTDLNGKFELTIESPYKPSLVQVSVEGSETPVFAFQESLFIDAAGVSVISDIDDTIKDTEVTSDKRTIFNNVFVKNLLDAAIPDVANWYGKLKEHDVLFHYVSNSPWQMYPTMSKFLSLLSFPEGSIHLKQYTGNILSSLMEPAVERKRMTLYKIFEEFPERKFILIGDSGEQDIEAYLDVSKKFPSQVMKIYIRVVPGSLSDFNDIKILREMKRLLTLREEKMQLKKDYLKFASNLSSSGKQNRKAPSAPPSREVSGLFLQNTNNANSNFEPLRPETASNHDKNLIDFDSSSPETSDDEMDKPNYDWNILSHEPLNNARGLPSSATAAAQATAAAASAMRSDRSVQQNPLRRKPPSGNPAASLNSTVNKNAATKNSTFTSKRKPPMVPKKPKSLQSIKVSDGENSTRSGTSSPNLVVDASEQKDMPQIIISEGKSTNTGSSSEKNNNNNNKSNNAPPPLPRRRDFTGGTPSGSSQFLPLSQSLSQAPTPPPPRSRGATPSSSSVSSLVKGTSTAAADTDGLMNFDNSITRSAPHIPSPRRVTTLPNMINFDSSVIKHTATDAGIISSGSSQSTQIVDRKGELWLQRLTIALNSLPDHVGLKFWLSPKEVEKDSLDAVKLYKQLVKED